MELKEFNQSVVAADKISKGPKVLFWYLTLFFTLGLVAFNLGALWFQYINKWLPQEVISGRVFASFDQTALKFAIASILVGTPIFFLFNWLIRKALIKSQLDAKNKIRVWVTYIILFSTIAIAVGDLITTIFRVLDGDYTLRFLFKALAILVISAWIFIYYSLELKSKDSLADSKIPKIMAVITIAVVAISFIGAFFIIDSPAVARAKAYDRTRIDNLQNISFGINDYYLNNNKLPDTLAELSVNTIDPKTEKLYTYKIISDKEYELCAVFETSNQNEPPQLYGPYEYSRFIHDIGEKCFKFNANPVGKPITEPMPTTIR